MFPVVHVLPLPQETLFRVEKLRRQILASRLPPVSLPTASTPSLPLSPDVEDAAGLHASLLAVQESAKRSESVLKSTITVIGEVEAPHAPPVTKHLIPVYQEDPPVTLPPPSPPRTSTPERQHVPVTSQLTPQVPASPERVAAMDSPLVVVSSIAGSPSASVVLSPATEQALLEFEEKGQPSAISLPPTSPPKPKGAVLVEPFTFEPLAPTSNAPVPVGAPSPIPGGSLGLQHSPGRLHPTVPVIPHFAIPKSSVSTPTGEGRISPVNPLVSTPHRTSPMSGLNNVLTLNTGIATLPDRAKVSRSISASALPSPSSAAVPSPHVKSLITSNSALSVVAVLTPSAVHVNTPSVSSGDASTGELRLSSPRLHTMDVPPVGISSLSHSLRPERTESVGTEGKPFYWGTELKQAVLSSRVPSTDTHQPPPILSPALHNTPPDLPFPSLQASLVESASSFVIPPSEEAPPLDGIGLGPLLSIELTEDDGGSSRQPSVDINDDGEQDEDANGDAPIVPFESPRTFTSEDQQFTPVLQTSSVVAPSPSVPAAAVVSLDPDPVPLDDVIAEEDTAESAPQPIVPIPIRQAHVPIRNPRNVVAVSKAAPQFGDDTFG